jgi:L-2-hydroxyglutarate oxidase LhgO
MEPEVLVIGAGAVGLACAAALARQRHDVLVVERHAGPGREISSRNSEVIHAGLYYPRGSLKATLCVRGRELLYERCRERGIPHRRLGKHVVATDASQVSALEEICALGRSNGAGALELIDSTELERREPRVQASAALWSPETGILDSAAFIASEQAEFEARGGTVVFRTEVSELVRRGQRWWIETLGQSGERFGIGATWVVNAAGLQADSIAERAGMQIDELGYRQSPCKGDYFALAPALGAITRGLVYPVPSAGGLGVHITVDLGGRYRLGPDVEWVDSPRYDVDPAKAESFAEAARRYLPEIRPEQLSPDFAGVRPKLQRPGEPPHDFVIEEGSPHGAPGLINLLGIESPGLTSALAIAERVVELIG